MLARVADGSRSLQLLSVAGRALEQARSPQVAPLVTRARWPLRTVRDALIDLVLGGRCCC